jgi:hypothetical protein
MGDRLAGHDRGHLAWLVRQERVGLHQRLNRMRREAAQLSKDIATAEARLGELDTAEQLLADP